MLNISKWFKDGFEATDAGNALINGVTELFKKNEEIVDRAGVSIMFKNGSRMIIRMASKAVSDVVEATVDKAE